jgi:hypothetical protein
LSTVIRLFIALTGLVATQVTASFRIGAVAGLARIEEVIAAAWLDAVIPAVVARVDRLTGAAAGGLQPGNLFDGSAAIDDDVSAIDIAQTVLSRISGILNADFSGGFAFLSRVQSAVSTKAILGTIFAILSDRIPLADSVSATVSVRICDCRVIPCSATIAA